MIKKLFGFALILLPMFTGCWWIIAAFGLHVIIQILGALGIMLCSLVCLVAGVCLINHEGIT